MTLQSAIETDRLLLRSLTESDVSDVYVGWLNDPVVNQFLEVRFGTHTVTSTREFVVNVNASSDTLLLGIFKRDSLQHIGNIKLGPINSHHLRADIGLMIGDRSEWGKGYASEAIAGIVRHAFFSIGLRKVCAGCYSANIGSLKAFEKVGFSVEARLPLHWQTPGGEQDEFLLGLTYNTFKSQLPSKAVSFGQVQSIVFIGGGDLLLESAQMASEIGFEVAVIMAPRHVRELLPLAGDYADRVCERIGLSPIVVEDINTSIDWQAAVRSDHNTLALCFGPAWVFSPEVARFFESGMINFNGIPIPQYLGGAHYTWQILNGSRMGGCFLQEIGDVVDKGDILRAERFDLPENVKTPQDYFAANHQASLRFIRRALLDFHANVTFDRISFARLNSKRLYFPRLLTKYNAFVDWRWTGREIVTFCNAFDAPYIGAASFIKGKEVRFRGVSLEEHELISFHPYVSGLAVRKLNGRIWIASTNGLIRVEGILDTEGLCIMNEIREGDRFATPAEALFSALTFRPRIGAQ